MAKNANSTLVEKTIRPYDTDSPVATHDEEFGRGGFRSTLSIAERNAITTERRKPGMLVFVFETNLFYSLAADLVTWNIAPIRLGDTDTYYPDIATGIDATDPGEYFQVADGENLKLYRNNAGTAQLLFNFIDGVQSTSNADAVAAADVALDAADTASDLAGVVSATTAAKLDAKLTAADIGKVARISQDETAGDVRTEYDIIDSGGGVPARDVASRVDVDTASRISTPAPFSIVTIPASRLDREIDAGMVNALQRRIAAADGTAADNANINAVTAEMAAAGKGTMLLPRSSSYYRLTGSLQLRSGVTFAGEGSGTRLRCLGVGNTAAQVFQGGGHAITTYPDFTYYAINNIAAGDQSVTFDTPAEAANFSDGQVVLVRATASEPSGDNEYPLFAVLNRIVNITAGVATFEHPFDEAVSDPLITEATGAEFYGRDTGIIDSPIVRNLSVYADDTSEGRWWAGDGVYGALVENIYVESARFGFNANAFCYSTVRGIRGMARAAGIELAVGCYGSTVEDVVITHTGDTSNRGFVMQLVEYARACELRRLRLNFSDFTTSVSSGAHTSLNLGPVQRMVVDDVRITAPNAGGAVVNMRDQEYLATSDIEIRDFVAESVNPSIGVSVANGGYSQAPSGILMRGGRIGGVPATGNSLRIATDCEIEVTNVDLASGTINVQAGVSVAGKGVTQCPHAGWDGEFTALDRLRKRDNFRAGYDGYAEEKNRIAAAVTSTTSGYSVAAFSVSAAQNLVNRDQLLIEAGGNIIGGSADKNISIVDGTGSVISVVVAAADTGAFSLRLTATIISNTVIEYTGSYHMPGGSETPIYVIRTGLDLAASGLSVDLQAWVDSVGPTVRFAYIDMRNELYGD